jgi:hypothetical protein
MTSFAVVAVWVIVAVIATLGFVAGLAATDSTLTTRTRSVLAAGCCLVFLLIALFFIGGGMLLLTPMGFG